MSIAHIVVWDLLATDPVERDRAADRIEALLVGLAAPAGPVDSLRSIEVVRNVAYPEKNGDVAVVARFDDHDGLDAYIVHPAHREAAAEIDTLVSGASSIDYEV